MRSIRQEYYRGINVCWIDATTPTTKNNVGFGKEDVVATPSSVREEELEEKCVTCLLPCNASRFAYYLFCCCCCRYGRKMSFGTFGKKQGRRALRERQHLAFTDMNECVVFFSLSQRPPQDLKPCSTMLLQVPSEYFYRKRRKINSSASLTSQQSRSTSKLKTATLLSNNPSSFSTKLPGILEYSTEHILFTF